MGRVSRKKDASSIFVRDGDLWMHVTCVVHVGLGTCVIAFWKETSFSIAFVGLLCLNKNFFKLHKKVTQTFMQLANSFSNWAIPCCTNKTPKKPLTGDAISKQDVFEGV